MTDAAMNIVEIDPYDDAALRAWYSTYHEAETRDRPFATPWTLDEARATAQAPPVAVQRRFLSGLVDGAVVCVGQVNVPLKDNLDLADLRLHTLPEHRRRGHGRRMLHRLTELAAEHGRGTLMVTVAHPYDRGARGAGEPGVELLVSEGFAWSLSEVQSVCPLPVPGDTLAALASEAAAHHAGYTLRSFVDRCPDDLVEPFGRLLGMLVSEAPNGELVLESEVYDEERIRAQEAMMRDAGRTTYATIAVDGTGDVVAYTQLAVSRHDSVRAYQWGTLVERAHRGHRLGLAVKAANLSLLQESEPAVSAVVTFNAETNDHMISVNRRFGFAPVARLTEYHRTVG